MRIDINKVCALILLAAPAQAGAQSRARYLMGTVCEIAVCQEGGYAAPDAESAVGEAFAEIAAWEEVLSLHKPSSELNALNREAGRGPFSCSARLWEAVTAALDMARRSGGAFDPTVLPAVRSGAAALPSLGYGKVRLDQRQRAVFFTAPRMGLDLGGIGKGLALDHAARTLRERGVTCALLNFGGQLYALGSPQGEPGWKVKIAEGGQELRISDESVSTSGQSERPGHILSPWTGAPVRRRGSVTVIAPTGAEADAWSTALFVLGAAPRAFKGRVYFTP